MINLLNNLLEKADNMQEYSRFQLRHGSYKRESSGNARNKNHGANMNASDTITR